jgi:acyl carrier protein
MSVGNRRQTSGRQFFSGMRKTMMDHAAKPGDETPDIKESLRTIICRELFMEDLDPAQIGDDDLLFGEKFGLDSIDAVELVFQVKTHFGVAIRDMKEGRKVLQSINTLAAFIEANRSA